MLVDDQRLVREGIRGLLRLADDVVVLGEAADGHEALELIGRTRPDVVLLDLQMPGLDGIGVLGALAETEDPPPVLVLTTFDDDELVLRALGGGARGYLLKDVSLDQLVAAVRTVAGGGTVAQPAVTDRLLRAWQRRGEEPPALAAPPDLTTREVDVLRLVAAGYANREIATALHLAEGTVKNHVSSLLLKLDARDRTRAVLTALTLGLLE
ncbi:response regulator transcription factor [Aeromicrobium alkaliterrae]|uniref:Response regulator transcription factor n=1 Tax=Aeromicrobium alkaliterrae TaxID=302168 RepID=A0ABN2JIE5_9ACTN